jgi:hypothetical protein
MNIYSYIETSGGQSSIQYLNVELECYVSLGCLARDKHSSLLDPFVSYEEDEVL